MNSCVEDECCCQCLGYSPVLLDSMRWSVIDQMMQALIQCMQSLFMHVTMSFPININQNIPSHTAQHMRDVVAG